MTHNLHIFDIIYYSLTFWPIRHFVPFDVLSHSTFSHSTFCLIRCYFCSTICPIRRFVPFDIFYVRYFVRSTFCPIRHFVCSTFCLIRHFGIRHFVAFDVLSFDVLSIRRLLLRHFVGEPIYLRIFFRTCISCTLSLFCEYRSPFKSNLNNSYSESKRFSLK